MGMLQSLEAPLCKGQVISIDFVGPLPRTKSGHDYLMVMLDASTKRAWYYATTQKITAQQAARVIFDKVVAHQGLPEVIVSDRDPRFTSDMWQTIWQECGTKLSLSSSFHPQSDGLTEQHNRVIQQMLRNYVKASGKDWDQHLTALEIAYNSSRHSSTGFTPYELDIGFNPKMPMDVALRSTNNSCYVSALEFFEKWNEMWSVAQQHDMIAKERQQRYANAHRREVDIQEGDLVLLQVNRGPQRQSIGPATKLGPQMDGPYRVRRMIGSVNAELELPDGDLRHPVIHVSQLLKFTSNPLDDSTIDQSNNSSQVQPPESDDEDDSPPPIRRSLRQRRPRDIGPFIQMT
jgi:hypothetical protein